MTGDIREKAIEAAARALAKIDGKIADTMVETHSPPAAFPLWWQYAPAARAAIAAYERAMWRPVIRSGEVESDFDVLFADSSSMAVGYFSETGEKRSNPGDGGATIASATHFRPLPTVPED